MSGPCQDLGSPALLHGSGLRLQLDELFGHLVGGPLGQDSHHRGSCLICLNAWPQGTPAHAALPVRHVPQLDHGHAHHPVRPAEAVVLHRHLELVAVRGLLPQQAEEEEIICFSRWLSQLSFISCLSFLILQKLWLFMSLCLCQTLHTCSIYLIFKKRRQKQTNERMDRWMYDSMDDWLDG